MRKFLAAPILRWANSVSVLEETGKGALFVKAEDESDVGNWGGAANRWSQFANYHGMYRITIKNIIIMELPPREKERGTAFFVAPAAIKSGFWRYVKK